MSRTCPTPGGRPPAPCTIFSCCCIGIAPPALAAFTLAPGAAVALAWSQLRGPGLLASFLGCIHTWSSLTRLLQSLSCCPWDGITLPLLQVDILGCSLPALLANAVMKHEFFAGCSGFPLSDFPQLLEHLQSSPVELGCWHLIAQVLVFMPLILR